MIQRVGASSAFLDSVSRFSAPQFSDFRLQRFPVGCHYSCFFFKKNKFSWPELRTCGSSYALRRTSRSSTPKYVSDKRYSTPYRGLASFRPTHLLWSRRRSFRERSNFSRSAASVRSLESTGHSPKRAAGWKNNKYRQKHLGCSSSRRSVGVELRDFPPEIGCVENAWLCGTS